MTAEFGNGSQYQAILFTHNPAKSEIYPEVLDDWIKATAEGRVIEENWSTGGTTKKIKPGDRAYLMRLGVKNRGIFASGWVTSDVYPCDHWDGSEGSANYADIRWDTFLHPDDALPIDLLKTEFPHIYWTPQSSGMTISFEVADSLDSLWDEHVRAVRTPRRRQPVEATVVKRQGQQTDVALRKQIENLAQDRLMDHFVARGWDVEDMRIGNSFDARATRGNEVLYLESKGTVTAGEKVIVTRGEVKFAFEHPGRCVMGIVSGIELLDRQTVDPDSGSLTLYNWNPSADDLDPRHFDFYPPDTARFPDQPD